MYGCESWTIKKAEYWRIDVFELWCWRKTPESPLDSNEIKPFNSKGNQPWIFILRTDAEAEAPTLWPPNAKSRLTGKDQDAGEDWRQKEKRMTEDEMRRGQQRMRWDGDDRGWDDRWDTASPTQWTLSKLWEMVKDREVWLAAVHGDEKSQTRLSNWTTTSCP